MTRHSLLYAFVALALVATPLGAQQPTQQAKPDSSVAEQATPNVIAQAQADGIGSGGRIGTAGWAVGGFFSGVVLGVVGTWITRSIAGRDTVELPPDKRRFIASQPVAYQQAYEKSFADRVKAKRKSSVLKGGITGMGLMTLLYVRSR